MLITFDSYLYMLMNPPTGRKPSRQQPSNGGYDEQLMNGFSSPRGRSSSGRHTALAVAATTERQPSGSKITPPSSSSGSGGATGRTTLLTSPSSISHMTPLPLASPLASPLHAIHHDGHRRGHSHGGHAHHEAGPTPSASAGNDNGGNNQLVPLRSEVKLPWREDRQLRARTLAENEVKVLSQIDDNERQLVEQLRQRLPNASNGQLVRFLRARNHDIDKAEPFLRAHLEWRARTLPIYPRDVYDELVKGTVILLSAPFGAFE
jgi:hypothetical protein